MQFKPICSRLNWIGKEMALSSAVVMSVSQRKSRAAGKSGHFRYQEKKTLLTRYKMLNHFFRLSRDQ